MNNCLFSNDLTHFALSRRYDQVKEEMLFEALTTRKTVTVGEKLIVPYKLAEVRLRKIPNKYFGTR